MEIYFDHLKIENRKNSMNKKYFDFFEKVKNFEIWNTILKTEIFKKT